MCARAAQVYVREVGTSAGGGCYEDSGVAVAPLWARGGGCALCALAAAGADAERAADAAVAAAAALFAAAAGAKRSAAAAAAGGGNGGGRAAKRATGSGDSSSSSSSDSDSDDDDSSGSSASEGAAAGGKAAPPPPPPLPQRPSAAVAPAAAPAAAVPPPPLPRTLGRGAFGCASGCACVPGAAPQSAVFAGGPNPVFLRPPPPPCAAAANATTTPPPPAVGLDDALLGYAVLLRGGREALLFLDVPSEGAEAEAEGGGGGGGAAKALLAACPTARCAFHAAREPSQQHPPLAATFHITRGACGGGGGYAAAAAALGGGRATQVWARGDAHALGFLAAARTTARLSALSRRVFPPPPALAAHAAHAAAAAAASDGAAAAQPTQVTARLLMRLLFRGRGAAPLVDARDCPDMPDAAALAAEALAARPKVAALARALPTTLRCDNSDDDNDNGGDHSGVVADAVVAAEPAAPMAVPAAVPSGNAAAAGALRAALLSGRRPDVTDAASAAAAAAAAAVALAPQLPPVVPLPLPPLPRSLAPAGDVIFLGTGCAEPSKHRGSAATLLRVPGAGCALLDCGEGAAGALLRCLGARAGAAALGALRAVLVSHHHPDHLLGLPGVLCAAAEASAAAAAAAGGGRFARAPPPLVVGPPAAGAWLAALPRGACAPPLAFLPAAALTSHAAARWPLPPAARAAFGALGLTRCEAVAVEHCPDAHALLLSHAAGWRLAFSGDCRPSGALAAAAAGATLLIHEATFGDDLAAHARAKRHCTTGEALGVAAAARAQHTVLTHFSQRYPGTASVALDAQAAPDASLAVDGMRLSWEQARGCARTARTRARVHFARACACVCIALTRARLLWPQLPHASALVPLMTALLAADEEEEEGAPAAAAPAAAPA
jgi:ribonuclease BN (tRNA processing enzyme)